MVETTIRRNRILRRPAIKTLRSWRRSQTRCRNMSDEQNKVKDKDQEYGYDKEYRLTSAVCLYISYKEYRFFNCF